MTLETVLRAPIRAHGSVGTTAQPSALVRRRIAARIRQLCEVPTGATVTQWAEQHIPVVDGGAVKGPYRVEQAPYQRRWQDLFGDPSTSIIVLCWASQLGKTTVIRHGIAYRMRRMPSAMLLVQPKIDRAESWVKEELEPLVEATPALKGLIAKKRQTLRFWPIPGATCLWLPRSPPPSSRHAAPPSSRQTKRIVSRSCRRRATRSRSRAVARPRRMCRCLWPHRRRAITTPRSYGRCSSVGLTSGISYPVRTVDAPKSW